MARYFKVSIILTVVLILGVCAYFLITPKEGIKEIELVPASESYEYTTHQAPYDDMLFLDGSGLIFKSGESASGDKWWKKDVFYKQSEMIIDTVCVNFIDKKSFTTETYEGFLNKLGQMSNYFWEESKHKFTMKFNVYIAQYDKKAKSVLDKKIEGGEEFALMNECKGLVYETLQYYGPSQAELMIYSTCGAPKHDNTNWPHVWMPYANKPFGIFSFDSPLSTCCHELYHILGIRDMYSNTGGFDLINFVGVSDIMSASTNTSTSAYFKKKLGWYNIGYCSDNKVNDIETISQSGNYILSLPSAVGETSAYVFGERGTEQFFVEQRKYNDGARFLVVQRLNSQYNTNINAETQAEAHMLTFGNAVMWWDFSTGLLSQGDVVGNANNPLYYADETRAGYCITNIKLLDGDKISFDFLQLKESDSGFVDSGFNQPPDYSDLVLIAERDIYVCAITQNGEVAKASEIQLYDSKLNKFVKVENVSEVYINGIKYYKVHVEWKHSRCKVIIWKYGIKETAEFKLTEARRYQVATKRNVLHVVGDVVNDIASTIIDYFHGIYRYYFN